MRVLPTLLLLACPLAVNAAGPAKAEPTFPFRTDSANENLPWYQLKAGEFPPDDSEHRVSGELLEADFIHRAGQFRTDRGGELVDFTLLPFASAVYLNAYADLRDVPPGTHMLFFLYQDEKGAFTRVAGLTDDYSILAGQGLTYRLDAVKLNEGKFLVTKQNPLENRPDLGGEELLTDDKTRFWKGDRQVKAADLAVGDQLLCNRTGGAGQSPEHCTDVWVGVETHKLATEQQRKKHNAFLKERGLPAWIDRVDGGKLTVTLFSGDRTVQPANACSRTKGSTPRWATEHRRVEAAVANEELRTYNPPVDSMRSKVLEVQTVPADCHGCSGERWVVEPELLLEGYRKGRVIRLFIDGWPIKDMPKGESLYESNGRLAAPHGRRLARPARVENRAAS